MYKNIGDYQQALDHYQRAVQIAKETGLKKSIGINLGNIGDLYIQMDRWDDAEQHLTQAVEICSSTITAAAGAFSGSLAWVYAKQSKLDLAKKLIVERESLVECTHWSTLNACANLEFYT